LLGRYRAYWLTLCEVAVNYLIGHSTLFSQWEILQRLGKSQLTSSYEWKRKIFFLKKKKVAQIWRKFLCRPVRKPELVRGSSSANAESDLFSNST
jgi:hypothetical protein